jgi:hypothetical protein
MKILTLLSKVITGCADVIRSHPNMAIWGVCSGFAAAHTPKPLVLEIASIRL